MTDALPLVMRQSTDAEAAVLGALMVTDAIAPAVIEEVGLRSSEFGFDTNSILYTVIKDLYEASEPHDELAVVAALEGRDLLEKVGGRHRVSELAATVPAAGNADHYAKIVKGFAADREKAKIGLDLQDGLKPEQAIERLQALTKSAAAIGDSSWRRVDLNAALDGPAEAPPSILKREDGEGLLYDGKLHQVSAEPESGKGWFACQATAELINANCNVLYADFESTPQEIVGRLSSLGVPKQAIVDRLIYVRPHEQVYPGELDALLSHRPALVIFDGITEALTIHGLSLDDNGDVAKWLELAPRPAARTGAAVLLIDHVTKNKENRGRFAIGAQHKLAGIDVAYSLDVVEPFGRGKEGVVKVTVHKDRPGHVRAHEREGEIALMHLSSSPDTEAVAVTFAVPDSATAAQWMPTGYMERISKELQINPGMSKSELRATGKSQTVDTALRHLIPDYVEVRSEGQAKRHYSIKPYVAEGEEDGY